MAEMTNEEWVAAITPDQLVELITRALEAVDFTTVDLALRLLATKDARRAQEVYDTMELGLRIRERELGAQ